MDYLLSLPKWMVILGATYLCISLIAGIVIGALNIMVNGLSYIEYDEEWQPYLVKRPFGEAIQAWAISIFMILVMPFIFWIILPIAIYYFLVKN